jgi:hypothetical protein
MAKTGWVRFLTVALVGEKIIQHIFVTLALGFNWGNIGATVAVAPGILAVLGAIVAVLFGVSLWGTITRQGWVRALVIGLALFDIVGEFAAQGKLAININVSVVVAVVLLVLAGWGKNFRF